MKKLRLTLLVACVALLQTVAVAQPTRFNTRETAKVDVFFSVGMPSFLFGEVGGSISEMRFNNIHPTFALGARQTFEDGLGVRLTLQYANFSGTDANSRNQSRNISYATSAFQTKLTAEYAFVNTRLQDSRQFKIYASGGAGIISTQSTVKNFRPSDRVKTSEFAFSLPGGLGMEIQLSNQLFFGIEGNVTYFFSDFIDGIQTNNSKTADTSANLEFTLYYSIFKDNLFKGIKDCHCEW